MLLSASSASSKKRSHAEKGCKAENTAAHILEKKGYSIVALREKLLPFGEIDIIAKHSDEIVFVEVKYRKKNTFGGAAGALSAAKLKRVYAAAHMWLQKHGLEHKPYRFDAVLLGAEKKHIIRLAMPVDE